MPFNPYQFIQMIKGGQNPQQLVMQLLENQMSNTPMGQNLLSLAKQNKSKMYKVLCHEIVHSIIFSYDILLNAYQEEVLANIVATYGKYIINIANRICSQI